MPHRQVVNLCLLLKVPIVNYHQLHLVQVPKLHLQFQVLVANCLRVFHLQIVCHCPVFQVPIMDPPQQAHLQVVNHQLPRQLSLRLLFQAQVTNNPHLFNHQ